MPLSNSFDHFLAGAAAGSAGVLVGHPFDTVKVQLQVRAANNKGIKECFISVGKHGMAKGFFRGLSWPFFSYGFINSVFFGVYGSMLRVLKGNDSNSKPNYMHVWLAGCVSGLIQLIPSCPCEVIKVVLQSQIPHGTTNKGAPRKFYSGPMEGAIDIIRTRGIFGMFRGFSVSAIRDVPANAIYFLMFEYMSHEGKEVFSEFPHQLVNFVSGGVAGVLSWAAIMPFDVVKSRMQADSEGKKYRNMLHCAVQSYQQEGGGIFFRGLLVTSLRAFPVNAIILVVYVDSLKILTFLKGNVDE